MNALLGWFAAATIAHVVVLLVLPLLPRLGPAGRGLATWLTRVPGLDALVVLLTVVPWTIAIVAGGAAGLGGMLLGQALAVLLFIQVHELVHRRRLGPARIVTFINGRVGRLRNHIALWVTVVALPAFLVVRAAEVLLWPLLVVLVRLPSYRQRDWVNVSRQKFDGLVGHDLVWCIYCDWMTGVYALGAEMLRNVESFWCPIRFGDRTKCANCVVDFPDVDGGWTPAEGTMADVVATMERHFGGGDHSWFGHPARLTVEGREAGAKDG